MITIAQYVGPHSASPDWTVARQTNAAVLLSACARLETIMLEDGIRFRDNPATGSGVSGETFGGFRPQDCPIGAPHSNHKEGRAVDRYDPDGAIDDWCLLHLADLVQCGIWLESPTATLHWSHWQCVPPGSGVRVFMP